MSLLTAIVLTSFAAAPVPKDPPKGPPETIDGEWQLVEFIKGGNPRAMAGVATMTFKNGQLTIKDGKRDEFATYTLDPKAAPMAIDLRPGDGNAARDQLVKGIYKFEKGKLYICFGMDGTDRPKEFKSEADSRTGLFTLERPKK